MHGFKYTCTDMYKCSYESVTTMCKNVVASCAELIELVGFLSWLQHLSDYINGYEE